MPHPYARRRRRPGKARLGTPGGHVGTPRLGRPVEGEGLARRIPRRASAKDRLTLASLAENAHSSGSRSAIVVGRAEKTMVV